MTLYLRYFPSIFFYAKIFFTSTKYIYYEKSVKSANYEQIKIKFGYINSIYIIFFFSDDILRGSLHCLLYSYLPIRV